jgi:rare lipoprotein A (peptidoglycan hydrolase)
MPRNMMMRQMIRAVMFATFVLSLTLALPTGLKADQTAVAYSLQTEYGLASWYSSEACKYNPNPRCPTAHGESLYDLEKEGVLFAAKWDVPFGTKFNVTNSKNGKTVTVVILDRGPNKRLGRSIDLCRKAFRKIANTREGVIHVEITRI